MKELQKSAQYLTKLRIEHLGFTFLAHLVDSHSAFSIRPIISHRGPHVLLLLARDAAVHKSAMYNTAISYGDTRDVSGHA